MLYCEKCMLLCDDSICPKNKKHSLRQPLENDLVLLTVKDSISSGMIESLLKDNDIPCMKIGKLSAGITVIIGDAMEEFNIYVPFGAYDKAKELVDVMFTEVDETEDAE